MNGMDSFHCLTSQLLIDWQAAANKHFKVASSVCIKCLHLDTTLTAAFQSYSHRWSSDHLSQVYSHCRQNLAANFYAESAEDMQMFPKIFLRKPNIHFCVQSRMAFKTTKLHFPYCHSQETKSHSGLYIQELMNVFESSWYSAWKQFRPHH